TSGAGSRNHIPTGYGNASGGIKLRKRTSAGSRPSVSAMRSIIRSITRTPCGRPAPRTAPVGWRFVYTAVSSEWMFGMRYGPGTRRPRNAGREDGPCLAVVVGDPVAVRGGRPVAVERDLHGVALLVLLVAGEEVLEPVLDPLDGAAQPAREPADQRVLRVERS